MSKKVKTFLERVEGENCFSGVLSLVADDANPASDFNLKETMQSLTRKVFMVMQLFTDSNANNFGVLSTRRRRRSVQRSSTLARVISDRECNNVLSFAPSYYSFGRGIGVFRQHYPHFAVGP